METAIENSSSRTFTERGEDQRWRIMLKLVYDR